MASIETVVPIRGSKAAAISNHVVRTMARVHRPRADQGAHVHQRRHRYLRLAGHLTKGERSDDLDALVLTMRRAFQGTMGQVLIGGVEEILGRKVVAFMSDNHIDPDVAVEVFVLAPADAEPQADSSRGVAKTPTAAMAGAELRPRAGT